MKGLKKNKTKARKKEKRGEKQPLAVFFLTKKQEPLFASTLVRTHSPRSTAIGLIAEATDAYFI